MSTPNTIGSVLEQGAQRLAADTDAPGSAVLDAGVLLAFVLGVTRAQLIARPEEAVDAGASARYAGLITRRAAGEPVAYLTGWRDFWSLRLAVTPAVLVPRPETELLVERALELIRTDDARVLELGTGSGAIALALAAERARWKVTATDLSGPALAVARGNAERLKLSARFLEGSWYEPLRGERFDLILSNPPYVAGDDPALERGALAYEPRLALSPGPDALASLRLIVGGAAQHLSRGGWLLLEHGADQAAAVRDELVKAGYRSVRSQRDLSGHERATEGQYDQI